MDEQQKVEGHRIGAARVATIAAVTMLGVAWVLLRVADRSDERPAQAGHDGEATPTLVVDSVGDGGDSHVGDGQCRDADGGCTLRAAIEESNTIPSLTQVKFHIAPGARNAGFEPAVIRPQSPLPQVSSPLHLDAPSQPGARVNTAPSPEPFNGRLGIVLDGSALPDAEPPAGIVIGPGAKGSTIEGLVISGFPGTGIDLTTVAGVRILGCYIGTDPTGLQAKGNRGPGISATGDPVPGGGRVIVGGPDPEDRNVISGNKDNAAYPRSRWTIAGNFIGLGADGLADVGNGEPEKSGALSIDVADDVVVGGDAWTDANVFAWNRSYAIAPDQSKRLTISHNYIGVASDGETPAANGSVGIILSESTTVSIDANVVMHSRFAGILVADSRDVTIGGTSAGDANVVSANLPHNIAVWSTRPGTSGIAIIGNSIGTGRDGIFDPTLRTEVGISIAGPVDGAVVGGTKRGEANVLAGGRVAGVAIMRMQVDGQPAMAIPTRTAVLGNRFIGIGPEPSGDPSGAAIQHLEGIDRSSPPDFLPDDYFCTVDDERRAACTDRPAEHLTLLGARLTEKAPRDHLVIEAQRRPNPTIEAATFRVEVYEIHPGTNELRFLGATTTRFDRAGGADLVLPVDAELAGVKIVATLTPLDSTGPSRFAETSDFSAPVLVRP